MDICSCKEGHSAFFDLSCDLQLIHTLKSEVISISNYLWIFSTFKKDMGEGSGQVSKVSFIVQGTKMHPKILTFKLIFANFFGFLVKIMI